MKQQSSDCVLMSKYATEEIFGNAQHTAHKIALLSMFIVMESWRERSEPERVMEIVNGDWRWKKFVCTREFLDAFFFSPFVSFRPVHIHTHTFMHTLNNCIFIICHVFGFYLTRTSKTWWNSTKFAFITFEEWKKKKKLRTTNKWCILMRLRQRPNTKIYINCSPNLITHR